MTADRENQRIDSTGDLNRETGEILGRVPEVGELSAKPRISPVLKWVLLADLVIAVAVVGYLLVF